MIESHESNEKTEESKDSLEPAQKEEERPKSPTLPIASRSPEPSCAICLEQLTNKSYADNCYHSFCFTCLLEWSKVKAECPLCKKTFTSIVHNVRSFNEFDQYHINKARITEDDRSCHRRFHYRTTLTPERMILHPERNDSNRLEFESYLSHRMRFAPHSVHSFRISYASSQAPGRIPNTFRQRVYDENLWVFPQSSGRVRLVSPEFFRQNIACTHRLLPWLNRELSVLIQNNENQVTFAVELIMALIVKYEIRSQEFHTLIEPYTASHTAHFIHEFYNFSVSPYETVESYDVNAQYNMTFQPYETVSSPDSDVIPLPMDFPSSVQQSGSTIGTLKRKKQTHPRKKHTKGSRKLKKIVLKRNSEKNCWESITPSVPFGNSSSVPSSFPFGLAGPSTSQSIPFLSSSPEMSTFDLAFLRDDDDEECQVVDVLKPKCQRTPEIVDLSSNDEILNVVDDDDNETTNPTILSLSGTLDQPLTLSDDECEILYYKKSESPINVDVDTTTNEVDKPIDYSLKSLDKDFLLDTTTIDPCSSSNTEIYEREYSQLHKHLTETIMGVVKPERNSVIQSVVHTVTTDDASSPLLKPKKRKAIILDDVSTESCSDSAQVSEIDTNKKKLKLKSVVAHYSYEHSDEHESTHHSSVHKKHKERKKKKKKHKHKRRIFSSDSDS